MATRQMSLRDAVADALPRVEPDAPTRRLDRATSEAIARESATRYREHVTELNRAREREIERALRRA